MRTNDGFGWRLGLAALGVAMAAVMGLPARAADIPTTDLKLWLKADAGITTNGNFVTYWADQSGNGYDAGDASSNTNNCPALIGNAVNGKPALRFDGVNDRLSYSWTGHANAGARFYGSQGTAFVVFKSLNNSGGILHCTDNNNNDFRIAGTGSIMSYATGYANWGGIGIRTPFGSNPFGSYSIVEVRLENGQKTKVYQNGGTAKVSDAAQTYADVAIGSQSSIGWAAGFEYSQCEVAEIIYYRGHNLTDAERSQVNSYLFTKYASGGDIGIMLRTINYVGNLQWQSSADNSTWNNIGGATESRLDVTLLYTNTPWFRVVGTLPTGTGTSKWAKVTSKAIADGTVIVIH